MDFTLYLISKIPNVLFCKTRIVNENYGIFLSIMSYNIIMLTF
jgi:hypothetical protein